MSDRQQADAVWEERLMRPADADVGRECALEEEEERQLLRCGLTCPGETQAVTSLFHLIVAIVTALLD